MNVRIALGVVLEAISTTPTNRAYSRVHDAAAGLPALSLRRPLHSLRLLLGDRSWMVGFALESCGFASYAAALALAPLALVQGVGAGGLGVLAYFSARRSSRHLGRRETVGVTILDAPPAAGGVARARGRRRRARVDPCDPDVAGRPRRSRCSFSQSVAGGVEAAWRWPTGSRRPLLL